MLDAGVDASVVKAHIEQSSALAPPTTEEIIYLHNHHVPSDILSAFIRRSGELRAQALLSSRETPSPGVQAAPAAAPAPVVVQQPTIVYAPTPQPVYVPAPPSPIYYDYPAYGYGWPFYSYAWPSVGFSVGFGHRFLGPSFRIHSGPARFSVHGTIGRRTFGGGSHPGFGRPGRGGFPGGHTPGRGR
jgi:hypothetical protein